MGQHVFGTFEAKNKLSHLLDLVEQGEEVVVTRNGKPVARLVAPGPAEEERRRRAVEAVEGIREMRKQVKPDPDGLTIRDYIEMGRRF
ncbi:type II toxin-antitoxin system prevent-host-death family antitoxin [Mesorhizobium sp. Z1-4]|uniref:type II toxin-antitoxin system Phd/YefM family antitoxin n=1 Tax=Mesorhizobium sp. Z1-4 TaxID=2448478 RepID=UPI000FD93F2F|nr:type II toxin-antitoxin system prevent-host-death family antitoxin [Mesorhizobium sp. Z1-4]